MKTDVIFRQWKSQPQSLIALFPGLAGILNPHTSLSYEHVGQHGTCDPAWVMKLTRPVDLRWAASLRRELEGIGYELRVIRKMTRKHYLERCEQCKR